MSDIKKRLVFSILQFLQQCINDHTIKEEDTESVEVAVQCIGEAFGVKLDDPEDKAIYSTIPPLLSIFEVANIKPPSKSGNRKVAEKDYEAAVKLYQQAIDINGNNAVYYSNRAAAYAQLGKHNKAIDDALRSTQIDPSYSKAYSRLGHAYLAVGKFDDAIEAYEKGLSLDPRNATMKSGLATAQQKSNEINDQTGSRGTKPNSNSSLPNAGGLGGLGGLAFMNAAQQMMQSGALNDILSNPNVAEMANNMMRNNQEPSESNQKDITDKNDDNNT
ncbi:15983_t:CDS:2 [Entrophospora sp. SA101]|nr:15983_t:CDS:2 [Entrophospora sp. SA101]